MWHILLGTVIVPGKKQKGAAHLAMNRPTYQCEVVVMVVAALHLNPSLLIVYGMVVTEANFL